MHPQLLARAVERGGVFTRADAGAAGYSPAEIRSYVESGRWARLRRGIYAVEAGTSTRFAAALAVLPPGTVLSHGSAVAVYGWPLLGGAPRPIEVTVPRGSPRRNDSLIVHAAAVSPGDRAEVGGLPVTSPARTLVDFARSAPFRDALVVADAVLAARVTDRADLNRVLMACRTWPGIGRAKRVLAFADPAAESPGESLSRVAFAAVGLPAPRSQVWVGSGAAIGRVDFLWEAERTVGEFDGHVKYAEAADLWAEKRREDRLRDAGYEVVRWVWADAYNDFGAAAGRIRAAFARSARRRADGLGQVQARAGGFTHGVR